MVDKSPVLLTTSRRPTGKIRAFCRDLSSIFPNIIRINRGKLSLEGVAEKALDFNVEKVIIVGSWKRGLGKIQLFEVNASGLNVVSPLMYMKDAKLPRDTKGNLVKRRKIVSIATAASEILSPDTNRFRETLSQFFNAPVVSFKQICSGKFDAVMQISYDLSNCITFTFNLHPELVDASPKTELSDLVWKLTG